MFIAKIASKIKHFKYSSRFYHRIMGIESSCDDTGCAIIDTNGQILGEALHSQLITHLNNGGVIPPIARELHRNNIVGVVDDALKQAGLEMKNLDAVAVTVKPGLPLSLKVGLQYAKYLCRTHGKPMIPIHHMQAHALTARLQDSSIKFPFLVLLISGGHCLVAIAKDLDKFLLLGDTRDDAPGEAFDKMARRMKLKNIPEYSTLPGGRAIELAARKAENPLQFKFSIPMVQYRDCCFSMSGIKNQLLIHLQHEEKGLPVDAIIPNVNNLCAGFQLVMTRHLCHRVQRAMEFADLKKLIPEDRRTLVVSGGAASNNFIAKALEIICSKMEYKFVRPPPKLCCDNGVMIAWNGVEKWKRNIDILTDFEDVEIEKSSPLGENIIEDVINENLSCKWIRIPQLNKPQSQWE